MTEWDKVLPKIELVVNGSVNKNIRYSPFFLMHMHHLVMPLEFFKDKKDSRIKNVSEFLNRMNGVWKRAKENMGKAQEG